MCCEIINDCQHSNSRKFHCVNIFSSCFNSKPVSDGDMASRFNPWKSPVSIADSKKLCDMLLREIKRTYSKTEVIRI